MPRFRFDIGLRNAIKDRQPSNEGVIQTQQSGHSSMSSYSRLRRIGFIFRKPARFARQYLVGDIETSIESLRAKLDFLMINAHHKLDELGRQVSDTQAKLETLHSALEEITLRVRGPILVDPSNFALRVSDGFILVPAEDTLLLLMLVDAGPFGLEPGTRRLVTSLLAPGNTFIDVGAHVGLLSLAAARAVGPTGHVLAIEPAPRTFELLDRTLSINGLRRQSRIERLAVGAIHERRTFYVRPVFGHSSLHASTDDTSQKIEIDVVPLDELVAPGTPVDVVKIDVEGNELAVLAGMNRILQENPSLAIIAEFGAEHLRLTRVDPLEWFEKFRLLNFLAFAVDELSGRCRRLARGEIPDNESVNILFVSADSPMLSRIPQ